jgi:hypothetical protein
MTEPLLHQVARAICETPGYLSRDYARVVRGDKTTVSRVIQRLRAHGYVRADKVAGQRGGIVRWFPTPALRRVLAGGAQMTLPRDPAPDDDNWTPRPWVHPYSAKARAGRAA